MNKRKPTSITEESEVFCSSTSIMNSNFEYQTHLVAGGSGDQDLGESGTVLLCTVRVLEMLARRGKSKHRELWGEIRKIAEREERRD